MPDSQLVADLAGRLSGKIIVSSDVTQSELENLDLEALSTKVLKYFEGRDGIKVLDRETLKKILWVQVEEKAPMQIEISKPLDYKPLAKDLDAEYRIRNIEAEHTDSSVNAFASYFNDRFDRLREFFGSARGTSLGSMLNSIESVKQYTTGREVSIVGMVYDKAITKNGHLLVTLEDETASAKILFVKSSRENSRDTLDLFESAKRIISDEVIAVRGKISGGLIIANMILWPDIPIRPRKKTEEDTAIAFLSDIHVGSKLFMEKQFARFLSWINGDVDYRRDIAEKVKYIVASGDLVDGIGVYPNQDKELSIPDIYKQYSVLLDYLSTIPDYIHVFLLPGNHDAVRRAEPQPALGKDLIKEFSRSNIHFVTDPGYVTVGGIKVLGYHGTSLDSVIQAVPGCSYSKPQIAMTEVLKRRHLSPIYGDNPIVPSKKDPMIIDEVPDILHMGHVHKNGDSDYHGTLIVNSGTWQARTGYQVKLGHIPSPAVLPVYETKGMTLSTVDFNTV